MRRLHGSLLALSAAAVVLATGGETRAVPQVLTQQGRLIESATGKPVAGPIKIKFAIYATETDTTDLWSEEQTVTLDDGYFSARLGETTPIPTTVFDGSVRYLGVTVGTDAEMKPREALTSVPYAVVATNVDGAITPKSVTIGTKKVIDETGKWVGDTTGLAGPPGPAGPSGFAAFRDSDSIVSGSLSFTFLYGCKTASYTAGPGERAFIWAHASCPVPANQGLGVRAGYAVNGGADTTIGAWHYHRNASAGTSNIPNAQMATLALASGSSYVFSTGLVNSESSTAYTATCYCHTMVQITK